MHAERCGKTSWHRFLSLRIKEQKPLLLQMFQQLSSKCIICSSTSAAVEHVELSLIPARLGTGPSSCDAASLFTSKHLLYYTCCLRILSSYFQLGWSVSKREWWFSIGRYHRAVQTQAVPLCKGWTDSVPEAVLSSQTHLFPWLCHGLQEYSALWLNQILL